MKLFLLFIFLLTACSPKLSPPVINSDGPPIAADTVTMVIHDTATVAIRDTVHDPLIQLVIGQLTAYRDTSWTPFYLTPSSADDWPAAQMILNSTSVLRFSPGIFTMSHGLLKAVYDSISHQYSNTWFQIEGACNAQNAGAGYTTLNFTNPQSFGIACQQAKGASIKNLYIRMPYVRAAQLTQLQIDTLPYSGWQDGICRFNAQSPTAAIVEDPFSARENFKDTSGMYPGYSGYYFSGMNQSGSTAVTIEGVQIQNAVVGILITAVNQQNGENNKIIDCKIDNCASAIAFTQAQAKTNYVTNLMSWGQTHTIFDGVHYGVNHGDGTTCPIVDGTNIAGYTYDIFEITTQSFSASASHVYAEGVFKIGFSGTQFARGAGMDLIDPQIDFQNGGPSPDFWNHGCIHIKGGLLRFYNGGPPAQSRIVLNDVGDKIDGTAMSGPPVVAFYQGEIPQTEMDNVGLFYFAAPFGQTIDRNDYDSIVNGLPVTLYVNRSSFTGYYLLPDSTQGQPIAPDTIGLTPGMLILGAAPEVHDILNLYDQPGTIINYQTPVGYVDHISADTVFLDNIGVGFRSQKGVSISKTFVKKL